MNCLKNVRNQSGMSQKSLGDAVGVSDRTIARWENGITYPREDDIGRLAQVLNVAPKTLLSNPPLPRRKSKQRRGDQKRATGSAAA